MQDGKTVYLPAKTLEEAERAVAWALEFTADGIIGLCVDRVSSNQGQVVGVASLCVHRPSPQTSDNLSGTSAAAQGAAYLDAEYFVVVIQAIVIPGGLPRVVLELFGKLWVSIVTQEEDSGNALKRMMGQLCRKHRLPGMEALGSRHLNLPVLPETFYFRTSRKVFGNGWLAPPCDCFHIMVGASDLLIFFCGFRFLGF